MSPASEGTTSDYGDQIQEDLKSGPTQTIDGGDKLDAVNKGTDTLTSKTAGETGGREDFSTQEIDGGSAEMKETGEVGESLKPISETGKNLTSNELEGIEKFNQQIKQGTGPGTGKGEAAGSGPEMSPASEGTTSDYGDQMELAASPSFKRALSQDYSLTITLPVGEFFMGCDDVPESAPRHKVKIDRPFRISKYPITMLQFLQFVKETGYLTSVEKREVCGVSIVGGDRIIRDQNNKIIEFIVKDTTIIDDEFANWRQPLGKDNIFEQKHNHPVTQVTWWDCMAYCDWLSQKAGVKFRLPAEKEWEYAASNRGQLNPGECYWNSNEPKEKHCNSQNSYIADTTPVDYFSENKTIDELRDMLGNVWEWTADVYCSYSESSDTKDEKQELKVVRGGSYSMGKEKINFSTRRYYKEMYASSCIGFRVVCGR